MSRDSNWEPVSFETEDDFWDFVSKRERRGRGNARDTGDRERSSDKRSGRRERNSRKEKEFSVYKRGD